MPVKSAELHRLARQELGPVLQALRFTRTPKTTSASWVRPEGDRWIVMWLQPSRSNDANSAGFRFTVEFRLTHEPVIGAAGPMARLARLLTDSEREELRHLENRAIAKLMPPDRAFAKLLPADMREHWLGGWKPRLTPYSPDEDVWFRHGDEDDVRALMSFFRQVLPGAVSRFVERTSGSA
jgi:hypothetical protein